MEERVCNTMFKEKEEKESVEISNKMFRHPKLKVKILKVL